ncbi:MAG: hypothetical protein ABIH34_02890 [Nanoarchaeota archaeon]
MNTLLEAHGYASSPAAPPKAAWLSQYYVLDKGVLKLNTDIMSPETLDTYITKFNNEDTHIFKDIFYFDIPPGEKNLGGIAIRGVNQAEAVSFSEQGLPRTLPKNSLLHTLVDLIAGDSNVEAFQDAIDDPYGRGYRGLNFIAYQHGQLVAIAKTRGAMEQLLRNDSANTFVVDASWPRTGAWHVKKGNWKLHWWAAEELERREAQSKIPFYKKRHFNELLNC